MKLKLLSCFFIGLALAGCGSDSNDNKSAFNQAQPLTTKEQTNPFLRGSNNTNGYILAIAGASGATISSNPVTGATTELLTTEVYCGMNYSFSGSALLGYEIVSDAHRFTDLFLEYRPLDNEIEQPEIDFSTKNLLVMHPKYFINSAGSVSLKTALQSDTTQQFTFEFTSDERPDVSADQAIRYEFCFYTIPKSDKPAVIIETLKVITS